MPRVLVYPSLDSLNAVEDTYDQRRLGIDCADAKDDLSLRCSHKSYCIFCSLIAGSFRFLSSIDSVYLETLQLIFYKNLILAYRLQGKQWVTWHQ